MERELDRQGARQALPIAELATELGLGGVDELYVAVGAGDRPARRHFKEVRFRQIRALVEGFDLLRHQFGDRRRDAVRGLRVAAPAAVLGSVLRDAVAAYRRSHPTVRLTLTDVPSQAAWRMVERDEADLDDVAGQDRSDRRQRRAPRARTRPGT